MPFRSGEPAADEGDSFSSPHTGGAESDAYFLPGSPGYSDQLGSPPDASPDLAQVRDRSATEDIAAYFPAPSTVGVSPNSVYVGSFTSPAPVHGPPSTSDFAPSPAGIFTLMAQPRAAARWKAKLESGRAELGAEHGAWRDFGFWLCGRPPAARRPSPPPPARRSPTAAPSSPAPPPPRCNNHVLLAPWLAHPKHPLSRRKR